MSDVEQECNSVLYFTLIAELILELENEKN